MNIIEKYFPSLTSVQKEQFDILVREYPEWNSKINVISRKDIDNLEVNHILHSLAIAKFVNFTPGTKVLDFGTGGGFPAVPLAVLFPEVKFHLVDRIGKKLKVAEAVSTAAGLKNITLQHGDIKEVKGKYDFIVSRAVMRLDEMLPLLRRLVSKDNINAIPNGLICLKGGDIEKEMPHAERNNIIIDDIKNYFSEEFFETKKVIYVTI